MGGLGSRLGCFAVGFLGGLRSGGLRFRGGHGVEDGFPDVLD